MRLILIAAAGLSLTACAGAPDDAALDVAPVGQGASGRTYGLFLSGNAALNAGRAQDAQKLFARAQAGAPESVLLRTRAFGAALAAGDVPRAVTLAPGPEADPSVQALGRLTRASHLIAGEKYADALAVLNAGEFAPPHSLAAALLAPWAAAGAGKPIPEPTGEAAGPLAEIMEEVGGLELMERAGRFAEADKRVAGIDLTQATAHTVVSYGSYLERRRRPAEAVALYKRALESRPESQPLQDALRRAQAGRTPPPPPSLREGAAEALLIPSIVLAGARQHEIALGYLRLALHLDPKREQAWVVLGEVLAASGDVEGARRAFMMIKPGSEHFAGARARLSLALESAGRTAEALETAQAAAQAAPTDPAVQEAYAALLSERRRFGEATAVFDRLIASPDGADNWRLWYLRGAAHEQAGRWPEAERDMQKALLLAPDEPEVLNYLGYSWVDRGQRLQQAIGMIERAAELRPRSGAIVDSLGWAHYRLGNYPAAVERLERAAELEPGDPVINDHLGDAYWRAGRQVEAQFQWKRVLTLEPEPELKTVVEAKLLSPQGVDGVGRTVASTQ